MMRVSSRREASCVDFECDGTGTSRTVTVCPSDRVCVDGACRSVSRVPGSTWCDGEGGQAFAADGLSEAWTSGASVPDFVSPPEGCRCRDDACQPAQVSPGPPGARASARRPGPTMGARRAPPWPARLGPVSRAPEPALAGFSGPGPRPPRPAFRPTAGRLSPPDSSSPCFPRKFRCQLLNVVHVR